MGDSAPKTDLEFATLQLSQQIEECPFQEVQLV